jgi:hypothetical protein
MWDFVKKQHRDLLAEACADMRSYQADGGAGRHRLENQHHEGVPMAGAKIPQNLEISQNADGKWIGNGGQFGPFDSVRDLELAVFGRSELSNTKRDFRDDAPKPGE